MGNEKLSEADVAIVGGGPAGLSAALILGRCLRTVILVDANQPRNAPSKSMHGFLSRDGIAPGKLREISLEQIKAYPNVTVTHGTIRKVRRLKDRFVAERHDGGIVRSRKILLATGRTDSLPDLPGIREFYGHSVFHCPQCDGWEARGKPLVVYGKNCTGWEFATDLLTWSDDITLCSDQTHRLTRKRAAWLKNLGIRVVREKVERLEGRGRRISNVRLENGDRIPCHALFFCAEERPRAELAIQLGASLTPAGRIRHDRRCQTNIPGCFTAGNMTEGLQMVVMAAAEGAHAAYSINKELNREKIELLAPE